MKQTLGCGWAIWRSFICTPSNGALVCQTSLAQNGRRQTPNQEQLIFRTGSLVCLIVIKMIKWLSDPFAH